jgi:membrane associated rhomboid family serine protease
MGIYDRDYYRSQPSRGGFAGARTLSVTTWLIIINVAVFFLDNILAGMGQGGRHARGYVPPDGPLTDFGYFSFAKAIMQGQVWRFITFQFLHANLPHLFWNMVSLYFFGRIVEPMYGAAKFLAMYLICGVAGTVAYMALWAAGVFGDIGPNTHMVGASAGIFGVLVIAAMIAPNITFMFIFPPIPMRLRTMAWIMLGIAAYTVIFTGDHPGSNAGGEAAHLGGAVMGFIFAKSPRLLDVFHPPRRRRSRFSDWENDPNH